MSLTDQQLRQELLKYNEIVPPITQRNREELRARLEILRSQQRSSPRGSPARSRGNVPSPRTRTTRRLIELSDSETDTSVNENLLPRRSRPTETYPTRSIPARRDFDQVNPPPAANVSIDVEESIARHRREIQQLMDSARDRTRAANANIAKQYEVNARTPIRPSTASSSRPLPSSSTKIDSKKAKEPSWFSRKLKSVQLFWAVNKHTIADIFKALLVGLIIAGALIVAKNKLDDLIPSKRGITCTPSNATDCDEMKSIVTSLTHYLQGRKGEAECGLRSKNDVYLTKREINAYLDRKGYKFEAGSDEQWNTLITYIIKKPVGDIVAFNNANDETNNIQDVDKLSAAIPIHSFVCRLRKTVNSAMQHLAWLALGTTFFLVVGWLVKRTVKNREQSENAYKEFVNKIIGLLENQYEEHLANSEVKPWLAVSHIRDMLIAPQDRKKLKGLWERAKKQLSESESRIRSETQLIHGEEFEVWRWIQPRSPSPQRAKRVESPSRPSEESYVYMPPDVGLTECLKLRNFFDPHAAADDDEIDLVVDSVQNRCATVKRIEHIGIHSIFVYLKFSSKEAAAQGFHLLNNWKYHGREIIAKYLRLERYHEHFPEARDSSSANN